MFLISKNKMHIQILFTHQPTSFANPQADTGKIDPILAACEWIDNKVKRLVPKLPENID